MQTILGCIAFGHNVWLVAGAALVCVSGCWALLGLLDRALSARGWQRAGWQFLAAITSGASIWCTHFVAMLAYDPGVPIGFDPLLTIVSALVASVGCAAAFAIAMAVHYRVAAAAGGALLGLSISAMHYSGMMAYRIEGLVTWNRPVIVVSVAIAILCGAAALEVALHMRQKSRKLVAAALLVVAIVGLHFVGMYAIKVAPLLIDPAIANENAVGALALSIVGMTLLIVGAGVVSYLIDQDVRADSLIQLQKMALHDGLTGLPNRTSFGEQLATQIEEARRTGQSVAVIAIDLDGFKEVNDQHGHQVGDAVLKAFAERLQNILQAHEFGARLGGDEFAIVHTSRKENSVRDLTARVQAMLEPPIWAEGFEHRIGASLGVAVFPQDALDAGALVNNADLAMYRAKAEPSDSVCFYEQSMEERVRSRRRLATELRAAIENNQIEVHYQLQSAVDNGQTRGYEALARWRHPVAGYIPPSEFIPIAEENGLIEAFGERVLRTACEEAVTWDPPYRIAVNVSAIQLVRPHLYESIASILKETGLAPARLEIELTESAVIRDAKHSRALLRRLRELGCTIALDDFGTGYSSLSTLRNFPFDKIKLDRSFMGEIETSPTAKAVLRAMLALGRGLNIPVLAEGIETVGQLEMLRAEQCSQAQGYLLGRPASMRQLVAEGHFTTSAATANKLRLPDAA